MEDAWRIHPPRILYAFSGFLGVPLHCEAECGIGGSGAHDRAVDTCRNAGAKFNGEGTYDTSRTFMQLLVTVHTVFVE